MSTVTDTPTAVLAFRGKHAFLSNFYPCPVLFEGATYLSAEHAYQAAKTLVPHLRRRIQDTTSPSDAKRLGNKIILRSGWDTMRVSIMRRVLEAKFLDMTLRRMLMETGAAELVEGNTWGDAFWGRDATKGGENVLGHLLMELRSKFSGRA